MKRKIRRVIALLSIVTVVFLPSSMTVSAAATIRIQPTYVSNRFYVFQNVHSGKFLEVADGNVASGTTLWQDTFNFDTNRSQVFRILHASMDDIGEDVPADEEYFAICPYASSNYFLDVDNANDANGTNIKLFGYNPGHGAQSFLFEKDDDNSFYIKPYLSRSSNRVLTVVNSSTSNKANVVLSTCTESTSQKWIIKEICLEYNQDPQLIGLNWSYFFRGDVPSTRRISRRVDMSNSIIDKRHAGIDLPAEEGTPIYSPCAGRVIEVGRENDDVADSMGNYVIIQSTASITVGSRNRQLTIRLMHMQFPPDVVLYEEVDTSKVLGLVGYSGQSDGNHLHVDINIKEYTGGNQIRNNPQYVINPEKLFLSKRFRYGLVASTATLATEDVFYPDWEEAM